MKEREDLVTVYQNTQLAPEISGTRLVPVELPRPLCLCQAVEGGVMKSWGIFLMYQDMDGGGADSEDRHKEM